MSRSYPFSIVDVFAERKLAGNQLAIVEEAESLSIQTMQTIALETNYSETTFVTARSPGRATVRIFTPNTELPFAGHPTIGTAWHLCEGKGAIVLDLAVGPVEVEFVDGIGWMTPPAVEFPGELERETAARLINLPLSALAPEYPVRFAHVGPEFVLIGVESLAALREAKLNAELRAELLEGDMTAHAVFVFCAEPYGPDADYAARMFFEAAGIREDPATGSANAAFAAYLRAERGNLGAVVVDQGVEINRPSRLYLDVGETLRVGGKVQPVVQGSITI